MTGANFATHARISSSLPATAQNCALLGGIANAAAKTPRNANP